MLRRLGIGLLGLLCGGAAAQPLQPANITTDRSVTPEVVQVLDQAGVWAPMGSINSSHVFIPVGGGGGGGGGSSGFSTHADLLASITATPVAPFPTLHQQGFHFAGDGGAADYEWNPQSQCAWSSYNIPNAADTILCILPPGQSSTILGRWELQHGHVIDVRSIGMLPSMTQLIGFDNSPYLDTLMNAMGSPSPAKFSGGPKVNFPPVIGQSAATYWFTQPFIDRRGGTFSCGTSSSGTYGGVTLAFAAGIDGFVAQTGAYTSDGGYGLSLLENCGIQSNGWHGGFVSPHATVTGHFSGSNFTLSSDFSGEICVGGTLVTAGGTNVTVTQLPNGATVSCDTSLTGAFHVTPSQTLGPFTPVFTGGTPGTISGLTAANFPVGSLVNFYGTGTMPTGLFLAQYVIQTASDTAAQIATTSAPTVPVAFTGSGSGAISADPQVTANNTGQDVFLISRFPADPYLNIPVTVKAAGDAVVMMPSFGAYHYYPESITAPLGTTITWADPDQTKVTISSPVSAQLGASAANFSRGSNVYARVNPGDKFILGNNTYTFASPLGTTPGNVALGTNWNADMANLGHAINGDTPAYPAGGAVYVTPPNVPNVMALPEFAPEVFSGFIAKAGGKSGNLLPAIYQPVGPSAGTFTSSGGFFTGGADNANINFIDLPAAQAYTAQSLTGSNALLVTAGPRLPDPGDLIIMDGFPYGSTIGAASAASQFTQIGANNFRNGDTIQAGNNTYTAVSVLGSTPGTFLIGPDFATSAANYVAAMSGTAGAGTTYVRATNAPTSYAYTGAGALPYADVNTITVVYQSNGRAGDSQPSVYTPTGTPAGSFQAATYTYYAEQIYRADEEVTNKSSITHPASSPGQYWVYPAGYVRRTQSLTAHLNIEFFGIGLEFNSSNLYQSNGSGGSRDEYDHIHANQIGRFTAGDNTGGSSGFGDQFEGNNLTDIYEGGTVGTNYYSENLESTEGGTAPYGFLMNCTSVNASSLEGGYSSASHPGCASANVFPPLSAGGPFQIAPVDNGLLGNTVMNGVAISGMDYGFKNKGNCFNLGSQFSFSHNCSTDGILAWNLTNNDWEWSVNSANTMRFVNTAYGFTGYAGAFGAGVSFPTGMEIGATESSGQTAARQLTMNISAPTTAAHIQGDTQINTGAAPGGNALWQDEATFSTTLSDYLWAGGGGYTGNISGTTLNVTSVHNATPVFTGGVNGGPGTIAGLSPTEFPAGGKIIFIGSGTLPTGLVLNNQYVIVVASATAATIAQASTPTVLIVFTSAGSGTITATKAICVGGAITGTGVGGAPKIVSLPGGATHGCAAGTLGAYPISAGATGGASFPVTFTGGTPGIVSGLTAANFPVNSWVAFYDGGSGVLPTGLSFNVLYLIQKASNTAAQLAKGPNDATPLAFAGAGSGTVLADEKLTSTGETAFAVAACPATALPAGTPIDNTSDIPPTLAGTLSACAAGSPNILTLQGAAAFQGAIGETIKFMQWYPGARIANDVAGTSWTLGNYMSLTPVALASLPATCTAGTFAVINNGVASPTYNAAVGVTTGAATNPVFCTNGNVWTYH